MKYHVTLKAEVAKGTFYWVCDVHARSEEEALTSAQHLFEAETEKTEDWSFSDYDVEQA